MAFRTRRRRAVVTWLPNVNGANQPNEPMGFHQYNIAIDNRRIQQTVVQPLFKDKDPDVAGTNLSDFTNGGYRLQRLVGQVSLAARQASSEVAPYVPAGIVWCGFILLRVTPATGVPLAGSFSNTYSIPALGNERDPWLWQRVFPLSNGQQSLTPFAAYPDTISRAWGNPISTDENAWAFQHFDIKVKRRVEAEERLCFVTTTLAYDDVSAVAGIQDLPVQVNLHYRGLATPLRTTNRRNASR